MRAYGFQYGLGCLVCCLLWRAPPVATPLVAPPAPETPMLAAPVPARPTGAHVVKDWSRQCQRLQRWYLRRPMDWILSDPESLNSLYSRIVVTGSRNAGTQLLT